MIGLDTGFFVELLRGDGPATSVWQALTEDDEEAVVSCITLFEIERLRLRKAIGGARILLEAIPAVCRVIWLRTEEIHMKAAALSHGIGMPAIDSLILAALLEGDARTIYTSDGHFESYRRKGVEIVNLRRPPFSSP